MLEVSRSSYYHEPKGESKQNLALMEQIDRLHLEHPYFGAERMAKHLSTPEVQVNVKRVRRLMREMDISPYITLLIQVRHVSGIKHILTCFGT